MKVWESSEVQGSGRAYWCVSEEARNALVADRKAKGHVCTTSAYNSRWCWISSTRKRHSDRTREIAAGRDPLD